MAAFIPDQAVHIAVVTASTPTTQTYAKGARLLLMSTTACYVTTGTAPTAVVGAGVHVPASLPVEIYITGDLFKIAAIRVTADGDLTITPAVG